MQECCLDNARQTHSEPAQTLCRQTAAFPFQGSAFHRSGVASMAAQFLFSGCTSKPPHQAGQCGRHAHAFMNYCSINKVQWQDSFNSRHRLHQVVSKDCTRRFIFHCKDLFFFLGHTAWTTAADLEQPSIPLEPPCFKQAMNCEDKFSLLVAFRASSLSI